MGDVGVSCDEPCPPLCLVDGGLSEPPPSAAAAAAASLSVTRLLQHAILQLCNEHVGYHHTLQVLGVLCVTVDDRPQEIVVKVNNTLKRVDSYSASGTPDNVVRVSTTSTRNRNGDAGNYRSSCNSSTDVRGTPPVATVAGSPAEFESIDTIFGNGRSLVTDSDSIGGPFNDENASTDGSAERGMEIPFTVSGAAVSSSQSGRKCHGRKQSNPVKVKHSETADEDLLVNMHDRIPASGNGVVINGRSALKNSPSSSDRHPKSNQILRNAGHSTSTPVTVRSLLAKNSSTSTSGHVHTAADEMEDANDIPQVDRQQEMALNFSMDALDSRRAESRSAGDVTPRSESSLVSDTVNGGGVGDVRVKEESLPTPSPPPSSNSTPYGMEYLLNALSAAGNGSLYDISQLSQIMAAANFGSLIGSADGRYLPMSAAAAAAAGFDPHQLQALMYRMSTQLSGASGALAPPPPPLINCAAAAAAQRGSNDDVAQASGSRMDDVTVDGDQKSLGGARQLYSVSQQLNNGLTMHFSRMQNGIRRRRFGRNPGGVVGGSGGSSATKVKDIIMYDESAPLHAQRGSRIEGDFMLDALRADGKRRRRRTAEDSLTVEEIAEYMGGDGRSTADDGTPASYQIACRYCGEVSTDLSRYFAHTLSSHGAYVCHQCGKSFTTKSSLLRHRPIHTGMRRFACSICRKEFYRKDKCKAHIKRHLGIADGAPATAAVASALSGPLQVSPATVEQPAYHVDPINVSM